MPRLGSRLNLELKTVVIILPLSQQPSSLCLPSEAMDVIALPAMPTYVVSLRVAASSS